MDGYITPARLSLYVTWGTIKMHCPVLKFHTGNMRHIHLGNSFLKIGNNKNMTMTMPWPEIKTMRYKIYVCPDSLFGSKLLVWFVREICFIFQIFHLAYLSMMEALCETLSILSWRAANACGFCIAWSLTLAENNMPSPALKKINRWQNQCYLWLSTLKEHLYCTQSFSQTDIHPKGSTKSCLTP